MPDPARDTDIAPPPFDVENPFRVPAYKNDTDWTEAVATQFRLIRGPIRKLRAVGVILLRLLP